MPFIDAETGTVLNGPLLYVDEITGEDELSDSEIVDYANHHGMRVEPVTDGQFRVLCAINDWDEDEWRLAFGFGSDGEDS